jgi:hypothetical protein
MAGDLQSEISAYYSMLRAEWLQKHIKKSAFAADEEKKFLKLPKTCKFPLYFWDCLW